MLKLVFQNALEAGLKDEQIRHLQELIWDRCERSLLSGIYLRDGSQMLGVFRGRAQAVLFTIEKLLRRPEVTSVSVISEEEIEPGDLGAWRRDVRSMDELIQLDDRDAVHLAQLLTFAVEASRASN